VISDAQYARLQHRSRFMKGDHIVGTYPALARTRRTGLHAGLCNRCDRDAGGPDTHAPHANQSANVIPF